MKAFTINPDGTVIPCIFRSDFVKDFYKSDKVSLEVARYCPLNKKPFVSDGDLTIKSAFVVVKAPPGTKSNHWTSKFLKDAGGLIVTVDVGRSFQVDKKIYHYDGVKLRASKV